MNEATIVSKPLRMFVTYELDFRTSYETEEVIDRLFGDRIVKCEEVRDRAGYLKGYDVEINVEDLRQ